ncbi:MAG: Bordetella virus [Pseudomonadota bacterium]
MPSDLDAAQAAQSPNPFDALIAEDLRQRAQRLRSTTSGALDTNPDTYAEQRRAAVATGAPPAAANFIPDEVMREARIRRVEQDTANSPVLQRRYADADFAKLAHDDSGALSSIEALFGALKDSVTSLPSDIGAATQVAGGALWGVLRAAADMLPGNEAPGSLAGFFGEQAAQAQARARTISPPREGVSGAIQSGVQSFTQNALVLPLALFPGGQGAALTAMTTISGGAAYQQAREENLPFSQALPFAASQAAIEWATEKIPVEKLLGDLKIGAPFWQVLRGQLARELPGEQVATLLQDLNEWAVLNPDKPFSAYLAERPSAALYTAIATAVGVGGNVTLMKGLEALTSDQSEVQRAQQGAKQLQELFTRAAEAKLRERDPGTFAQLVQQMADSREGGLQAVYVDGRVLGDLMQKAGISQEQLGQMLPSVPGQLGEAIANGGAVEIPIGEAMASLPGSTFEQSLVPNLRVDPRGVSQVEAEKAAEESEQLLMQAEQRVLQEADDVQAAQQDADAVKQIVLDQLNEAKRFTPQVNEAYATLVRAFFATTAARLGTTAQALYARYPLRVVATRPGGENHDQSAFHGSPHRGIEQFTTQKIGTGEGAQVYGWGMYFAGNKEVAEWYRKKLSGDGYGVVKIGGQPQLDDLEFGDMMVLEVDARPPTTLRGAAGYEFMRREMRLYHESRARAPLAWLDAAEAAGKDIEVPGRDEVGQLYEVDVPDDDNLLAYDAEIKDQPASVKEALAKLGFKDHFYSFGYQDPEDPNGTIIRRFDTLADARSFITRNNLAAKPKRYAEDLLGREVYRRLVTRFGSPEAASRALFDAGVPGLRYLDGSSRGAIGEKSYNYVIFDDSAVTKKGEFYQGSRVKHMNPAVSKLLRNLTPDEQAKITDKTAAKIIATMKEMPSSKEMAAVAWAGRAKRGWYKNSADALSAVFGPDAPRFAALLAAMSPQTSVENNLFNTLMTWKNWTAAGRPTERKEIVAIMGRSVMGSNLTDSVLPAWINNSVTALTHEDPGQIKLSGPKVNSFFNNLVGVVEEVTNDAWMANYALVSQTLFKGSGAAPGKGPGYIAMSAKVRDAAAQLTKLTGETWTPAEVQETVWSWAKTVYETANAATEERSAQQLIEDQAITDEMIRSTPDFGSLFYNETYASILTDAGYAEQLEALGATDAGQPGQEPGAGGQAAPFDPGTQRRLELQAARRLDTLAANRGDARAASVERQFEEDIAELAQPEQVFEQGGDNATAARLPAWVVVERYRDGSGEPLALLSLFGSIEEAEEAQARVEDDDGYGDSEYFVRKATEEDARLVVAEEEALRAARLSLDARIQAREEEAARQREAREARPQAEKDAEAEERALREQERRDARAREAQRAAAADAQARERIRQELESAADAAGNPKVWAVFAVDVETGEREEIRRFTRETSAAGLRAARDYAADRETDDDYGDTDYVVEPWGGARFEEGAPPPTSPFEDFTPANLPNLLRKDGWAILTAGDPGAQKASPEQNRMRQAELKLDLQRIGAEFLEATGSYGDVQNSLIVTGISEADAMLLGAKYGQESILTRRGLIYQDGSVTPATGVQVFDEAPQDFYTSIPGTGAFFSLDLDFDTKLPPVVMQQPTVGVHFSRAPREVLDGRAYGTGLKGLEARRLEGAEERLRARVYVYLDEGTGVRPEAGVGGFAHEVKLPRLYDARRDPLKLWNSGDLNATEARILDAGLDGYFISNAFNGQGAAVIIGPASHALEAKPIENPLASAARPTPAAAAPQRYRAELMSKEIAALEGVMDKLQAVAPSAKLRSGALTLDPGELNLARNVALEAGVDLPDMPLSQVRRGTFNPATLTTALLEPADLSTFLHETGHFFLTVLADIASQQAAPSGVADDMSTVLRWFGKDLTLDQWNGMSVEQQRPYHEKFAESFEQYLFENKAPSPALRALFGRFRAWLVNVYRSLKEFMAGPSGQNASLSDEVRGVMDRLLATEEEIAQAERLAAFEMIYKSAEEAGMTPEEWEDYQATHTGGTEAAIAALQARSLSDMRWAANARSAALKKAQKAVEGLRKATRDTVAAEVAQEPVYAAQRWMKTGVLPDGTQTVGAKLSTAALRDMYGDGPAAPWRYLATNLVSADKEGSLHPDVVAEMFGFSSGDALVRGIVGAFPEQQHIDGITERRLLEEHGDLVTPRGIAQAANEAVHNEVRARFVATELRAMQKAMNQRAPTAGGGSVNVIVQAAKNFAERIIAQRKVRDLKPSKYEGAEARAAKKAAKDLAAGKTADAIAAKRDELLNHYTARYTYDAQAEVKKAVEYFRKFDTVIKGLDTEYQDQIVQLLARYDLTNASLKAIDKRKALAAWLEEQRDEGLEPDIPAHLLADTQRQSFKDMTVEEVRGLRDAVKQIEHLGRLKNKLLTARDDRDFAAVRDEIAASIHDNAGDRQADTRTPNTVWGEKLLALKKFWAAHIKAATWARVMDGGKDGGPVWEYLVRSANQRSDQETSMIERATKDLAKLVAPVIKQGGLHGKGRFFPSIKTSLNREAVLALALNSGNAGNLQRVLGGEGWTMPQLQPVLESLTAADWAFVQEVWDYIETFRPEIAAKEKRIYGKEPTWVEPVPFEVNTADGKTVKLRGGYYPIRYDPRASAVAEGHADADDAKRMMRGAYTSATTRRSFVKDRAEEVVGRPVLLSLDGIYHGVQEVIHDLAWHEWLIDSNKLLRAPAIADAMRERYGPDSHRQFKTWVQDIAQGDTAARSEGERALAWIRQGVSISGLGFNVMTAMIQPLGITQSIVRVGPRYVGKGIAEYIASPVTSTKKVHGMSEFMRTRSQTRLRELAEVRAQVKGRTKVREAIDGSAYFLMLQMQQAVDVPTWLGAYEKAIAEGRSDETSRALADQAVVDAQGGGALKDRAAIERGGQALKLFTVFYSFFNATLNLGVGQTMTSKSKPKLAADYLMLFVVPVVLGSLLKEVLVPGGDDDDPEKLMRKLAGEQLGFLMGLLVGVREMGGVLANQVKGEPFGTDYTGPAGLRLLGDAARLGKQVGQGEADDGLRKAIINTAGSLLRLPSAQINRSITGAQALADGETDNPMAILTGYDQN